MLFRRLQQQQAVAPVGGSTSQGVFTIMLHPQVPSVRLDRSSSSVRMVVAFAELRCVME